MKPNPVIPGTPVPVKAIWLHPDGMTQPYLHMLDGDCGCKTCESKIRYIIYPVAA